MKETAKQLTSMIWRYEKISYLTELAISEIRAKR